MKRLVATRKRSRTGGSGSALVEFALGSTLLLTGFTATFQFGYIFYRYNALENAVNTGARWASMASYDSPSTSPSAAFQVTLKNMVLYGSPTAGASPVVPGLTSDNVVLTVTFENDVPAYVQVHIVNYTISAIFGNMNCSNKPVVRYAYQGLWVPI